MLILCVFPWLIPFLFFFRRLLELVVLRLLAFREDPWKLFFLFFLDGNLESGIIFSQRFIHPLSHISSRHNP